MLCSAAYAQKGKKYGAIKGKLINAATKAAFGELSVSVPSIKAFTISTADGSFIISELPYGSYDILISGEYAVSKTVKVTVANETADAGTIEITPSATKTEMENQIPTIAVDDAAGVDADDDNNNSSDNGQNMMGYFTPAQDQFLFNTSRTFGSYRFRPRGVNQSEIQFNGFDIRDVARGWSAFSLFGGLNDVLRSRNVVYGIKPADFTFGALNGTSNYIDATAASQRKGTSISYAVTNRSYRNRLMVTHNSGLMKNGWAYSLSFSKRWAKEGYYDGTFYDGYSFYGSASKTFKKGILSLTTIGAPTSRGLLSTAIDETYDLAGDNKYNPSWGYQNNGEDKRSGRTSYVFQPITVASYAHNFSDRTRWNTSLGYQFGKNNRSGIDFYNGYNPAPDYYRNLPSYYINGVTTPNPTVAADVRVQYLANPNQLQIQWDNLYQANYMNVRTIENANGSGSAVTGRQSIYVFSNQVDNMNKFSFNSTIDHSVSERLSLQGGVKAIRQSDEYYKELADLMGGDFYVNFNQFAAQASPGNANVVQNDLNNINQIIKKGDKYGYDYTLNILEAHAWGQGSYNYKKFNVFASVDLGNTSFSRDGKTRSGIFPNESFGKSDNHSFFTFAGKAGVRFQPDAKNIFFANVGVGQYAPNVHNTYISERTRNTVVDNPEVSVTKGFEGGYQYKSTSLIATFTAYVNEQTDMAIINRFFNDDPDIQSYVNYVMQNVTLRSIGGELSLSYKINESFTLNGNASVGQMFYANRPTVSIYQDNNPAATITSKTVYIENYYFASGPQSVYTAGLTYRPGYNTRVGINVNYMDRNYVGINPERRTTLAVDMVDRGSVQWDAIVDQEKMPSAFTVDVNAGKTWNSSKWTKRVVKRGSTLALNVSVSNLLNNTDIKMIGYEQLRYDYRYNNANKFPNKYTYAMGLNFFAGLSLRF